MDVAYNLGQVLKGIPTEVTLVAVSKTHPNDEIMKAYNAGQRTFGENKVQELVPKYTELPKDIKWHFVGHLQSNKVKYIASFIHTIHSVDSLALLREIDKYAKRGNRVINVLLQVHIAKEETKFGFNEQELLAMIETPNFKACSNVSVCGLMGMATLTDDINVIRSEFQSLAVLFKSLKETKFKDNPEFCELSMGMSSDYEIAIEEGSTMVRVGGKIFGERHYSK